MPVPAPPKPPTSQAEIDQLRIIARCTYEILCAAPHKISMQMGSGTSFS